MATHTPGFAVPIHEFAVALLSEREVAPRARHTAQQLAELLPGTGVVVYVIEDQQAPQWTPKAAAGAVTVPAAAISFDAGTLGAIAERREPLLFAGSDLAREDYAHLDVRRTVVSLSCLPLTVDEVRVGAIEIVSFDAPLTEASLAPVMEIAEFAAIALATALGYESERNSNLQSISRLAQLYDLEKVFNSTLEMETLLALVPRKFQEILNVQAVNLWLVQGDSLMLMGQAGRDPTVKVGASQKAGEGMIADLAETGDPVLIESDADERLQRRNFGLQEGAIVSYIAAPLMSEGAEVGFVEAINKLDGTSFDEDDLFFLTTVNETAAGALKNASLLHAERKVEILETLVKVSQEITSTLNLDRMLQTIVNAPQAVIPYERAAIALEQHGRLKLSAVSGIMQLNRDDPEIAPLNDLLQWAAATESEIWVRQHDGQIDELREETRAKFQRYFSDTGVRGFYCHPLVDDTGRVGVLAFESSDPDFLSEAHLEMIQVLASQATVALRNAQMYKEVPFIGLLEPVLEKKRKFMAMERKRRRMLVGAAVATALFLTFFPVPMRLGGDATVAPQRRAQVEPEVEGVVAKVYVREGQPVKAGDVLAELRDWEYRAALAGAQAKYSTAVSAMNRALVSNDGGEAGIQRLQADVWASEVERSRERLEKTKLRSPINGVVATPRVENLVGRRLQFGDSFAEVVDSSATSVDVAIEEKEAVLMRAGNRAVVKLNGFPTRTFEGQVAVVSPRSELVDEQRVFFARVNVPNQDSVIRPGMQGRGKVSVGWHAAGYVLFRGTAMWLYSTLWSWFGW
ncbi:MAG TPA: efflux RND transporter periplasmic adaptor subunit [Terriglobales bacterium]|nr:efflux RND transporter periplasmic adaptor subunit [Terriglobales bacterium]